MLVYLSLLIKNIKLATGATNSSKESNYAILCFIFGTLFLISLLSFGANFNIKENITNVVNPEYGALQSLIKAVK